MIFWSDVMTQKIYKYVEMDLAAVAILVHVCTYLYF